MNTNDRLTYQELTDICFENGGATKPIVDKLYTWHNRRLYETLKSEYINLLDSQMVKPEYHGIIVGLIAECDRKLEGLSNKESSYER